MICSQILWLILSGCVAQYRFANISIPTFPLPVLVNSISGWIIVHQKLDDTTNFNLNWVNYKAGFGIPGGNVWIDLERMHQMTSTTPYRLRIELQAACNKLWHSAEYDTFQIDQEALKYAIHVTGYVGDAGDSLQYTGVSKWYHNTMKFSTKDADNDRLSNRACAAIFPAGSWFNACYYFLLTGSGSINEWDSLADVVGLPSSVILASRMMIRTLWKLSYACLVK